MTTIPLIIVIIAAAFTVAMFASKSFRTKIFTIGRAVTDKVFRRTVSPVERQKIGYEDAVAQLAKQTDAVQRVMAISTMAGKHLEELETAVNEAKRAYIDAKELNMDETDLDAYALAHEKAKAAVEAQKQIVAQAAAAAEEAKAARNQTRDNLETLKAKIKSDEGKAALADAIKIATESKTSSTGLDDVTAAGEEIELALETARAGAELAETPEDKLNKARESKRAKDARAALDAELSGNTPPAAQ